MEGEGRGMRRRKRREGAGKWGGAYF